MKVTKETVDYGFAFGFVIDREIQTLVLVFGRHEWLVEW